MSLIFEPTTTSRSPEESWDPPDPTPIPPTMPPADGPPHQPRHQPRHRHPHLRNATRRVAVALALIVVAVLARIVGLGSIPAVVIVVMVGLAVRGSVLRRRDRRSTVVRLVVVVALMAGLAATSWSYTGALTFPGSDPVSDRTANWMRDHHMSTVVDTVEQHLYTQTTSTNGVVDQASLPNTPTAATGRASADVAPAAATTPATPATPATPSVDALTTAAPPTPPSTASSTPPTTAAPIDHTPPTAGPLIDTTLAGEGQWTPNARTANGVPVTYTTFVRPDAADTGIVAAAVVLEPAATTVVYVPGTADPGGTGWAWGGTIPADQRPALVAAFNSGWKQRDSPGGAYTEGHTAAPLIDGKASIVIYADGHDDIGAWGTDVTMTPDVVSVRQNLDPIVSGSQPVDGLTTGGSGSWGKAKYQLQHTRRSGLGITADGALVYVAGSNLTTTTLAHALVQVGAVRAMELDIHNQHPTFNFFTPAPGTADGVTGQKLLPEQTRPATRYLQPDQRDFFAVLAR